MRSLLLTSAIVSFIALLSLTNSHAQSDPYSGAVDAKLLSTPTPTYPEAAKKTGIGGKVSVLVAVDKDGNVTEVKNVFGPGSVCPTVTDPDVVALRDSARTAAFDAKFTPATHDGKPVGSFEVVEFKFARGDSVPAEKTGSAVVKGQLTSTEANSTSQPKAKTMSLVNGTVVSMPKPPYPAAGKAVRARGAVAVQVLIDENGFVYSADAISGHPLLRPAATIAACKAQFTQTLLEGKPIKVTAVITYNFVP